MLSPEPLDPRSIVPCTGRLGFPAQESLLAGATQLHAVDVDADGRLDLVGSGYTEVRVFRGAGGGSFGAAVESLVMEGAVGVADVVGSSTPDLLVSITQAGVSSLAIYTGFATGRFATSPQIVSTATIKGRQIEAADLNNDGKRDIVVHDARGIEVAVILATATGFAPAVRYNIADSLSVPRMVLADLGGDARLDIAVVDSIRSTVNVLVNQGDGTFAPRVDYATGASPKNLLAADVNEDGKADLLVARPSSVGPSQIDVLLQSVNGFSAPMSTSLDVSGTDVVRLAAADIDADGHVDIAAMLDHDVAIARGTGTGQFTLLMSIPTYASRDLVLADVGESSRLDLIVLDDRTITPYLNTGTAMPFEFAVALRFGPQGDRAGYLLDLDGNGRLDLVGLGSSGLGIKLATNTGFGPTSSTALPDVDTSFTLAFDADNDSRLDVLIDSVSSFSSAIQTLHNDGTGSLPAQPSTQTRYTAGTSSWKTADLNGDGFRDAVRGGLGASSGEITFYPGVNGTFASTPVPVWSGSQLMGFVTLDLDEDGDLDIVTGSQSNGLYQEVVLGQGGGAFNAPVVITSADHWPVAVRDFNEDGHLDILSVGSGGYVVLLGNGTAMPTTLVESSGATSGTRVFADFDGDGHLDIASILGPLVIARGRGDGSFHPPQYYGVYGDSLDAGDIDGDGRVDLFVHSNADRFQVLYGRCL